MPEAAGETSLLRAVGAWGLAASIVNVVCAFAMGLIALCFAQAGSRVSMTGGPYAYVEVAFGPFVGFIAGVLVWLLGTLAVAAVSTIFIDSIGALVPSLDGPASRGFILVAIFLLLAGVNVLGVRQGTLVNAVATLA